MNMNLFAGPFKNTGYGKTSFFQRGLAGGAGPFPSGRIKTSRVIRIAPGASVNIHQSVLPLRIDDRMDSFPSFKSFAAKRAFGCLFYILFYKTGRGKISGLVLFPESGDYQKYKNSRQQDDN